MTPPELLDAARTLSAAGVLFRHDGFDETAGRTLSPEQAALAASDPDAMVCSVCGLTPAALAVFRDKQCRGTTAAGGRCLNTVASADAGQTLGIPEDFDPDAPGWLYCNRHRPEGGGK